MLKVPDEQPVHAAADAAVSLYVPATHADTEIPLPVYPASARLSLSAFEAAGLDEPFKQVAQSGGYLLALQGAHAVPTTPMPGPQHCPVVAQSPATQLIDPCSELFPASQGVQVSDPLPLYFPPLHGVQVSDPFPLYFPPSQGGHMLYPTRSLVAVPAEQRTQAFVVVSQ